MSRLPTAIMTARLRHAARALALTRLAGGMLCLCALASCSQAPKVAIVGRDGTKRTTVSVEIADSPSEREVGLMYRTQLGADSGMLFVFATPSRLTFWMKNTEIPLDMVFADADAIVVGVVANAEPLSQRMFGVPADSKYVLEVNGGFSARHGIKAGDHLEFVGFVPIAVD